MRLPPFLRFLEPKFHRIPFISDGIVIRGHLKVTRQRAGGPLEPIYDSANFIVNVGLTAIRDILIGANGGGFQGSIFRMAVGDGGCPAGELFNPKLPDATWPARDGLFHEILRQDVAIFSTPTTTSMRFVGSFNSTDVDPTSYQLADRVINEASLIAGDGVLTVGGDKKQIHKVPPDTADPDEVMVSMRTFKSASFDLAEDVTITLTWTLTVAKS